MNARRGSGHDDDGLFYDDDDEDSGQADKYLLFNLGEEVYGIDIGRVTEIIELQKVTAIPDMPAYIRGVINLRGKAIPVMDLRLRIGISERSCDDRTCVIIVNMDTTTTGEAAVSPVSGRSASE